MKFKLSTFLYFSIISTTQLFAATRNELSRYYEMRDKTIIDRSLKRQEFSSYFELDLTSSSGTYDLFTDINSATSGNKTTTEKNLLVAQVLNKQINVEHFLDLDLGVAIPLPEAQLWGNKTLLTLFGNLNLGMMQSFENQSSILNPSTQVYLKMEYKYGLSTRYFLNNNEIYKLNLYQILRKDIYSQLTYAQITQDGKLFNTSNISNSHKFYALDFAYDKTIGKNAYLIEAKEISLLTVSNQKSAYGNSPLLHTQFYRPLLNQEIFAPFIGIHYRKAYDLGAGLYIGSKIKYSLELPFVLITKVSNTFLTLTQNLELKWLILSYSFNTAWRNPQNDLWVPPLHSLYLSIPI